MQVGLNLEFTRSANIDAKEGLKQAQKAGYHYVEPYLYSGIDLPVNSHLAISTSSNFNHFDTGVEDTDALNQVMRGLGLRFSAMDAHSTLLLPQIGVPYLKAAVDFAAAVECPIVMSDEGPTPAWLPLDRAFDLMCVSLEAVIPYARQKGVLVAIELHNALTTNPKSLMKLMERFSSDELGINFDTGNSFLAGNDPLEMLETIARRVVHVHAKDIPESQLAERGKVTGTRVGVAIGDGVIDFNGIISCLKKAGYQGVISVECDTYEQAGKSLLTLGNLLSNHSIKGEMGA